MINFGAHLDDDLFENEEKIENIEEKDEAYTPKKCENEWFLTASEEDPVVVKYKADLKYFEAEYKESLCLYKKALELATNTTVRRDCLEAIARSSLRLGRLDEALSYAELMYKESCNTFQKTNASNLLANVYHYLGQHEDELLHLESFSTQNEWNADVWLRLAICYANLSSTAAPAVCGEPTTAQQGGKGVCPEVHTFDDTCSCLTCPCHQRRNKLHSVDGDFVLNKTKIFACAYRSRWLFESCQTGNRSFAGTRYTQGPLKSISRDIAFTAAQRNETMASSPVDHLGQLQQLMCLDFGSRKLSRFLMELNPDKSLCQLTQKNMIDEREEADTTSSEEVKNQVPFESRWFSWIQDVSSSSGILEDKPNPIK